MKKYTVGLKFKDYPYNGYAEIHTNSLKSRISFPTCISGQVTVVGVVVNKKVFKLKPRWYISTGVQVSIPGNSLYKLLKHDTK